MESLNFSQLGQWELIKSDDPYTVVRHHDGTEQKFPWHTDAVTHLLNSDYLPTDASHTHFRHTLDPNKTAHVETHQPALKPVQPIPERRK